MKHSYYLKFLGSLSLLYGTHALAMGPSERAPTHNGIQPFVACLAQTNIPDPKLLLIQEHLVAAHKKAKPQALTWRRQAEEVEQKLQSGLSNPDVSDAQLVGWVRKLEELNTRGALLRFQALLELRPQLNANEMDVLINCKEKAPRPPRR